MYTIRRKSWVRYQLVFYPVAILLILFIARGPHGGIMTFFRVLAWLFVVLNGTAIGIVRKLERMDHLQIV